MFHHVSYGALTHTRQPHPALGFLGFVDIHFVTHEAVKSLPHSVRLWIDAANRETARCKRPTLGNPRGRRWTAEDDRRAGRGRARFRGVGYDG